MDNLPVQPGSYTLVLRLRESRRITVGRLGEFDFLAGYYLYFGSARGPGGVRARLGRHLRGDGKTRWHIDYLRAAAQVWGYGYQLEGPENFQPPFECWGSQKLAARPEFDVIIPKFGASDCAAGCPAHLSYAATLSANKLANLLEITLHNFVESTVSNF